MKYTIVLCLILTGCAAAIPLAIQAAPVVLSEAAKIACNAQAQANAAGESELSKVVGALCTW